MNPPPHLPADVDGMSRAHRSLVTPLTVGDAASETIRVLHVDDDAEFGETSALFLERVDDDLSVVTETSATDGLERLDAGSFDCVVSDYQMPGTGGLEFLEEVRDRDPDMPFILFTGEGSEDVASEAISRGVTDYVQKGGVDRYTVLANRIENAVDRYRTYEELLTILTWYRRLVEQDLAGIYLVQDREFVYVNERFAEIFGYSPEELVGESVLRVVHDDVTSTVVENLRRREQGEVDAVHYTWTGVTKGGEAIDVEVHGGVIDLWDSPAVMGILLGDARDDARPAPEG